MNYSVKTISDFDREAKGYQKKHKLIKYDISDLINELEINTTLGVHLGQNVYKIRLAISGSNKGKSGGARVINYVLVYHEAVFLAEIYLKSEYDSFTQRKLFKGLRKLE